jgi:hypothetical protein
MFHGNYWPDGVASNEELISPHYEFFSSIAEIQSLFVANCCEIIESRNPAVLASAYKEGIVLKRGFALADGWVGYMTGRFWDVSVGGEVPLILRKAYYPVPWMPGCFVYGSDRSTDLLWVKTNGGPAHGPVPSTHEIRGGGIFGNVGDTTELIEWTAPYGPQCRTIYRLGSSKVGDQAGCLAEAFEVWEKRDSKGEAKTRGSEGPDREGPGKEAVANAGGGGGGAEIRVKKDRKKAGGSGDGDVKGQKKKAPKNTMTSADIAKIEMQKKLIDKQKEAKQRVLAERQKQEEVKKRIDDEQHKRNLESEAAVLRKRNSEF